MSAGTGLYPIAGERRWAPSVNGTDIKPAPFKHHLIRSDTSEEEYREASSTTGVSDDRDNLLALLMRPDILWEETHEGSSATLASVYLENFIAPLKMERPLREADELTKELSRLFLAAKDETFEDGMETAFSRALQLLIEKHRDAAVDALTQLIVGGEVSPAVASEALRWLGYMEDAATHAKRRRLLERCLNDPSSRVRDGAILGLAFMDDPQAIHCLKMAIEREAIGELKEDMEQVLAQLEDRAQCRSF